MKKLILFFFFFFLQAGETNIYESIAKRNAFDLTAELPKLALPPVAEILKPNLYLTGLTHFKGVRKVHLVLKHKLWSLVLLDTHYVKEWFLLHISVSWALLIFDAWSLVLDSWFLPFDVCLLIFQFRSLPFDFWSLIFDFWFLTWFDLI